MKKILFVLGALIVPVFYGLSQNTMYFMDRLPQTRIYNPAFIPDVGFYISLPGIGNNQAEIYNSGFNYKQFSEFSDNLGNENYDPDDFINLIGDYNETFIETGTNLFSLGFKLKQKGYFSFSISERNILELTAPSDFVYLLDDYENSRDKMPLAIDGMNVRLNAFTQFAATWTKMFGEKLTIGVSPKMIGAIGGVSSRKVSINIDETGPEEEDEFETNYEGIADVGLPVPINPVAINAKGELDTDAEILDEDWLKEYLPGSLFKRISLAFDLGVKYDLNERWSFSASLLDAGSSAWRKTGYLFNMDDTVIRVSENNKFRIRLPAKVYLAGNYRLSPRWDTGLLVRNAFYNEAMHTSATISLNGYVGRMLSTSVSYTAAYKFDNLGLGVRLRFLPGTDLYVVTDNILHAFNYKKAQHATLSFGINLAFGIRDNQPVTEENNIETMH